MLSDKMRDNKKDIFGYILIFLLASVIGVYFRAYPLIHFTSSDSSEKATVLVLSRLKSLIAEQVNQQYPDIPALKKNQLIEEKFDQVLREEGDMARKSIEQVSASLESHSSSRDHPYLLASDSYYYYGLTENILKTGKIAPTIKGSKYFNEKMLAPVGHWEPLNLHPYIGFTIYKIIQIFKPDIPLMHAVGFTPLVIAALALIPFVLICRALHCSLAATFVGSVFFILAPIFIKRSAFGWYDNDPYNTLFPLLVLSVLFMGFNRSRTLKESITSGLMVALSILLYALFWHGWVYLFSIILIAGMAILFFTVLIKKSTEGLKILAYYFGSIILGTLLFISFVFGFQEFFALFNEGVVALKNFLSPQLALWPDLYISVGELRKASLPEIIDLTGGYLAFVGAALGTASLFLRRTPSENFKEAWKPLTLSVFLLFTIVISMGAQRFALICLVPLSLLFSTGVQYAYEFVRDRAHNTIPLQKKWISTGLIACGLLLTVFPVRHAYLSTQSLLNPIFNTTWGNALTKIKQDTPEDSIINTWWPPGHFITSIAKRRVTFDGASINNPQAYWMANVLLSTDEKKAAGLLRMLNNSANQAVEYLQSLGLELSDAVQKIFEIVPLNKDQAYKRLAGTLTGEQAGHLLGLTHRRPPPSYAFVYKELVEKSIQLDFVGKWDFKKIEAIRNTPEQLKAVPGRNTSEYVSFLWGLIGGPFKVSEPLPQIGRLNDIVLFEQNVQVNLSSMTVQIRSKKFGEGIPRNIFYVQGEDVVERNFFGKTLNYSVVLIQENDRYFCILMEEPVARSMLVRLFYFKGKGLKYFKPFSEEQDLTKRTHILVYEVDWNRFFEDLSTPLIP